jgi:hypothetical protein
MHCAVVSAPHRSDPRDHQTLVQNVSESSDAISNATVPAAAINAEEYRRKKYGLDIVFRSASKA